MYNFLYFSLWLRKHDNQSISISRNYKSSYLNQLIKSSLKLISKTTVLATLNNIPFISLISSPLELMFHVGKQPPSNTLNLSLFMWCLCIKNLLIHSICVKTNNELSLAGFNACLKDLYKLFNNMFDLQLY